MQTKGSKQIPLHEPDVCEAKHAYKNNTEYNKACKLKEAEEITQPNPRCLWGKARIQKLY